MTVLPDNLITQFQELAKEEYGVEITRQQALQEGLRLAGLIQVGLGLKLTTDKYENYNEEKTKENN